jgi:Na+/phosphate symporter
VIDDEALAGMSDGERRALALRLARYDEAGAAPERRRRRFVLVAAVGSLVLVPWIGVLAVTLPHRYVAVHWTLAWVGFDTALLLALAATSFLAWRGRPLMVCDAWFDTTTANRSDRGVSVLSALLLELPMAVLLVVAALLVLRRRMR